MHYKTMILELLEQRPEIYEQLRKSRRLLQTIEAYARELKESHESWKEQLRKSRSGNDPSQIASEALEMALKDLEDRMPSASPENESDPITLDAAMDFLTRHTSRG